MFDDFFHVGFVGIKEIMNVVVVVVVVIILNSYFFFVFLRGFCGNQLSEVEVT